MSVLSSRQLVFLRHGITPPQEQGRYCGHLDPTLSVRGQEQVIGIRERILGMCPTQVWSSDLRRCLETAALLRVSAPCHTAPEFREIAFGDFENRLYDDIAPAVDRILSDPDLCFPSGESVAGLLERVGRGIKRILAFPAETTIIVAHAGSIAAAALILLNLPLSSFWSFQLPHVGIAVFTTRGEGWTESIADWKRSLEGAWPA